MGEYIGKCVEGWEDAKEAVRMMVEEEIKRRQEMMEGKKEEMMQLTQDERNAVEVEADKKGLRERVKAKLDPAHIKSKLDKDHIKSKLDKDHIKSKLDPAHIKSKLDEKFSKTKLDHLKQKMIAKTGGAEENNE